MIRTLNAAAEKFLSDIQAIAARQERAQRQVSSGRRLNVASDDPDQVGALLQTRANLARTQQNAVDLGRIRTEVDTAEQNLQKAVEIMDRARVLAAHGGTGTATTAVRSSLADEAGSLLQQLISISATTVEGRYIFSGDSDQTAPYSLDMSVQPYPVGDFLGSPSTRDAVHPSGTRFRIARTAQDIFDSPEEAANVFHAVNNLRLALLADDEDAIRSAAAALEPAGRHLSAQLSFYGSVQNSVAEAADSAARRELSLKTELSGLEDADLTEAILELTQSRMQLETAMEARSRVLQKSLFDYL